MYYPIWDVPLLGGALVIAGIAILHVIIAHFAVGAGIFNALTEQIALKRGDETLLSFVRTNSRFLIYFSFVAGAVSGVGIWFSIGLVSPEATTYLMRLFFWVWAIEWVVFLVELVSGYVYYYTWDRISPRLHLWIGWLYALCAILSLVLINGILTFMLTPGDWAQTGKLYDAWLNPSFWPSLCLRLVSSVSLAGIFVALVASKSRKYAGEQRSRIVKWGARFLMTTLTMPFLGLWYFTTIPVAARDLATGGAIAMTFLFAFGTVMSFLIGVYAYFGMLRRSRDINFETALLMAAIAFIATASLEFVREGIRKPYLIRDVVYSNGILLQDVPALNEHGLVAQSPWVTLDSTEASPEIALGKAVFQIQCLRCHQIDGYNAMIPLVKSWNRPLLESALDHLDRLKGFMPPFVGTAEEKAALTDYLLTFSDSRSPLLLADTLLQEVQP
jgi:mono/diheme cytochrome c family protein